jgi:hypothetical protein
MTKHGVVCLWFQLCKEAQKEEHGSGQLGHKVCLKNNQHKKDWQNDSTGGVPAYQVWGPEFSPQSWKKKNLYLFLLSTSLE